MLWGGGFLFLLIYSLTGNHILKASIIRYFRKNTIPLDISITHNRIYAGESVKVIL